MSLTRSVAAVAVVFLVATCLLAPLPARADDGPKTDKAKVQKAETEKAKPEAAKPEKADESKPAKKPSFLSKLVEEVSGKSAETKEKPKPAETKDPAKQSKPETPKAKPETKLEPKPEAKPETKPAKPEPKKATVVKLTLTGEYPEGASMAGPFGEMQSTLAALVEKFDQLAEDKDVAAVVLEIEDVELGGGKVNEVREAIARVRKSGKPVYAVLTGAEAGQYLLACACDEILIVPSGMLLVPGVRAEVMFYKGLLDKIGVEADMLQMGKYKGAGEPYTRTNMSEPLRESFDALMDDTFERFVANVAKDRKLEDYKVKTLIDQGLFTAEDAKKAGLVDQVIYLDEFLKKLQKDLKADQLNLVTKYKSNRKTEDFSGIGGMMKLVQMMLGGKPGGPESKNKKVAVVYAVGPIMEGKSASGLFSETLGSTTIVEALQTADKDPTVVAIVLRVDSPGGSAIASDLIWRETVRIKKPIIASMGNVAGSGGYYISVGADKILAEPSTLTGSIGVIGGKLILGKLYQKIGLSTEVISRGKNSGLMSADKPFTPSEREAWLASMKEIYRQFVSKSAQGRKMPYDKLEKLAQGRIYTGNMAVANGLVDRLGTLHDAVAEAKKAAGVKTDEKVELLILPRPKSVLEQLFGDPEAAMESTVESAVKLTGLADPLLEINLLRRLFAEPALTLMPYRVELK